MMHALKSSPPYPSQAVLFGYRPRCPSMIHSSKPLPTTLFRNIAMEQFRDDWRFRYSEWGQVDLRSDAIFIRVVAEPPDHPTCRTTLYRSPSPESVPLTCSRTLMVVVRTIE